MNNDMTNKELTNPDATYNKPAEVAATLTNELWEAWSGHEESEDIPANVLYTTDGVSDVISFVGIVLWSSEDETIALDDAGDPIETVEWCVRRRFNALMGVLSSLGL